MPRIKRWFPVNHNINRDPEVWAMRRAIGEKSLSIWLEFLSIADQNDGQIPGDYEALIRSVSGTCQAATRSVRGVYEWAVSRVWLASEPTLHVVKYWNYHKQREPINPLLGSLLTNPSDPILTKPPKAPHAQPDGFAEFWTLYPKKKSKGQAEKAWRSLDLTAELFTAIIAGVRRGKSSRDWLKDSGKYIPHPATWIRAQGWEDQESISFSTPKPKLVVSPKKLTDEEIARNQEFLRDMINSLKGKRSMG